MGIVAISGTFCICSVFIDCPHFGASASKSVGHLRYLRSTDRSHTVLCTQRSHFTKSVVVSQLTHAVNMLTDLLSS